MKKNNVRRTSTKTTAWDIFIVHVYRYAIFTGIVMAVLLAVNTVSIFTGNGDLLTGDGFFIGRSEVTSSKKVSTTDRWWSAGEMYQPGEDVFFSDVDENGVAYPCIAYCVEKGYMEGFPDGSFQPNEVLTRGEFAQVLYNILGEEAYEHAGKLADVTRSDWFYRPVMAVVGTLGIEVKDVQTLKDKFGNTAYHANAPATRLHAVILLDKLIKFKGLSKPVPAEQLEGQSFKDIASLDKEAQNTIKEFAALGVLQGLGDRFLPGSLLTREQAAMMIYWSDVVYGSGLDR